MTRTLILGGAGFIGSHLAERLLETGRDVTVMDSFKYCYPDNLQHALESKNLYVIAQDATLYLELVLENRYDEIYHMASLVSTNDFVSDPIAAFWTSVLPMNMLLEHKRKNPQVRLLFTSSSEVYGNPDTLPTPETELGKVDFRGPRSGYDAGKRSAETLIASYQRIYGVGCAVVRLFNTFGPRMRANGRLIPTMVRDALREGHIQVNKPGSHTRTLLYVDDCVSGIIKAMEVQSELPVNLGGRSQQSILQIATNIVDILVKMDNATNIEFGPELPHDVTYRQPYIARALELFAWQPITPIEEGIKRTIAYWQEDIDGKPRHTYPEFEVVNV